MSVIDPVTLRDNIFSLNTRRFGTVAEIIIKKLLKLDNSLNQFHDLYDRTSDNRIEVKFSRAEKAHPKAIRESNILEIIADQGLHKRMLYSDDWANYKFDSNIQQVKPTEFDVLYYGLFFADAIMIFRITTDDLHHREIGYSNKQHKGNVGEGQFHLNNKTYQFHLDHFFVERISYEHLLELLEESSS